MFQKWASVQSLGAAQYTCDGFRRVAYDSSSAGGLDTDSRVAGAAESFFMDGARKIDVRGYLEKVADKYKISTDPSDYLFEAIRANSSNVPNENHDAFTRSELKHFDAKYVSPFGDKIGMPVYMTYIGKPHHVQHRASDPTRARGVILDASYNDVSPALENCPQCSARTASIEDRDGDSGIHCKACTTPVKDEFVEILVAVDKRKDPDLIRGIQAGILTSGSMGCNCASTICNVCSHMARSTKDFCEHIRAGNKGSLWVRQGSKFAKISQEEVRNRIKQVGWSPIGTGNHLVSVSLVIPGSDFEVRKAFENCRGVEFDEYSRVHRPADLKARSIEVLKTASAQPTHTTIQQETEDLLRQAQLARIAETTLNRTASKNLTTYYAVRVNGGDSDMHVSASLNGAIKMASLGKRDTAEWLELQASDERSALARAITASVSKAAQFLPVEADVQLVVPNGMRVNLDADNDAMGGGAMPGEDGMPGVPGQPGTPGQEMAPGEQALNQPVPGGIDNLQKKAPPSNQSPEEFGIMPPGASGPGAPLEATADEDEDEDEDEESEDEDDMQHKFSAVYSDLNFAAYTNGVVVRDSSQNLITFPAVLATDMERRAMATEIADSCTSVGLVRTASKYNGVFSSRLADSLEGITTTLTDKPAKSTSALEGFSETLKDKRAKPGKVTTGAGLEGLSETIKARDKMPSDSISSRMDTLADTAVSKPESATKGLEETLKEKRPSSGSSDSSLEGLTKSLKSAQLKLAESESRVQATEDRLKRLFTARLEESKTKIAEETAAKYERALKLVAKRRALNMEDSPLKSQMFDKLTVSREIGRSASTGQEIEYNGMDDGLALHLIEAAWQDSVDQEIETLVHRASEIVAGFDEAYFATAESDLAKQATFIPAVVSEAQLSAPSETQRRAASVRDSLVNGNFVVAPVATDDGVDTDSAQSRLRTAVAGLPVSRPLFNRHFRGESN